MRLRSEAREAHAIFAFAFTVSQLSIALVVHFGHHEVAESRSYVVLDEGQISPLCGHGEVVFSI
jgi:hypothetical protein